MFILVSHITLSFSSVQKYFTSQSVSQSTSSIGETPIFIMSLFQELLLQVQSAQWAGLVLVSTLFMYKVRCICLYRCLFAD